MARAAWTKSIWIRWTVTTTIWIRRTREKWNRRRIRYKPPRPCRMPVQRFKELQTMRQASWTSRGVRVGCIIQGSRLSRKKDRHRSSVTSNQVSMGFLRIHSSCFQIHHRLSRKIHLGQTEQAGRSTGKYRNSARKTIQVRVTASSSRWTCRGDQARLSLDPTHSMASTSSRIPSSVLGVWSSLQMLGLDFTRR